MPFLQEDLYTASQPGTLYLQPLLHHQSDTGILFWHCTDILYLYLYLAHFFGFTFEGQFNTYSRFVHVAEDIVSWSSP